MKKLKRDKKLLIVKIIVAVFALIIAVMPSSASRNLEVNNRVIVEMMGLDGTDEIEVTAQYVMPTGGEGTTSKSKVSVKGRTITEAVEMLHAALGRRVELGHCSMLVLGKDFDIASLGTLITASDITANVYMIAAKDKAKDLVGDLTDFMKKTGATDADYMAYSAKKNHAATITLLNFLSNLESESKSAFMPIVEIDNGKESEQSKSGEGGGDGGSDQSGGGSDNGGSQSEGGGDGGSGDGGSDQSSGGSGSSGSESEGGGESGKSDSGGDGGMKMEKLALYDKSGRVGELDELGARGVSWISSPIEKGVVVSSVEYDGKEYEHVSARFIRKNSTIKTDAETRTATIKLDVTVEPNCNTYNELLIKSDGKAREAIKQGYAKSIEKELRTAFEDAAKYNCDPFFIRREFYRHSPQLFENGSTLDDVKVEYDVKIYIQ